MSGFHVTTAAQAPAGEAVLAVPVLAGLALPDGATAWPEPLDPSALAGLGFEGKAGQVQALVAGDGRAVVAVGLGEPAKLSAESFRRAAACTVRATWRTTELATTLLEAVPPEVDRAAAAQALAEGARMAAYRFTAYRRQPDPCRLQRLTVVTGDGGTGGDGDSIAAAVARGARVAEAVWLARDLVNEPAGRLTPTQLAERARAVAASAGLGIEVLDEAAILEQRLGGLAGVARGSAEPPRLVELTYEPDGDQPSGTVVLVGKGITFDSGGLSLKTADGMMTMKTDMSGAAAVLGAMSALKDLGVAARVIGLLPITENMPGGRAIKPGDILEIRDGTTVEVLNTDAEGRLVLADALCLAAERRPDAIVDLATLTGAQVVALGRRVSGLMGNAAGWVEQVRAAAERAGEPAWPLPLPEDYRGHLDSEVADLKNIGKAGEAGTLVAGLFLKEFVAGIPWAHLDIAGPARAEADDGYLTKGGTGVGVRTLLELLRGFVPIPAGNPPVR